MRNDLVRKGISRIIIAQFLRIASVLFSAGVLGVAFFVEDYESDESVMFSSAKSLALLLLSIFLSSVIGLIIYIVGVRTAAKEEPGFKSAIKYIVLSTILSVIKIFLVNSEYFDQIGVLCHIFDYLAIASVIKALSVALDNDPRSAGSIKGVSKVIKVCYIAIGILVIASGILTGSSFGFIAKILEFSILLLQIVAGAVYITQLRQAE